jgi:hypothetical protein
MRTDFLSPAIRSRGCIRGSAFVQKLRATPGFAKEVATPPEFDAHLAATRKANLQAGKTLEMVAGF